MISNREIRESGRTMPAYRPPDQRIVVSGGGSPQPLGIDREHRSEPADDRRGKLVGLLDANAKARETPLTDMFRGGAPGGFARDSLGCRVEVDIRQHEPCRPRVCECRQQQRHR